MFFLYFTLHIFPYSFQIFLALEHPYEKMYLQELQDLVLLERLNLKNMIYNLTSNLKDEDLDILYDYANMERRFANATDEESVRKVSKIIEFSNTSYNDYSEYVLLPNCNINLYIH